MADYEAIIHQVLNHPNANIYIYHHESLLYPTLTSTIAGRLWLVIDWNG